MGSVCAQQTPSKPGIQEAIARFGSIFDIPEEEACKLCWNFWDSGQLVDDLFFFVSKQVRGQHRALLQVCRHSRQQHPEINVKVDWNATLALNYICHLNFILRVSVCAYFEDRSTSACHLVVKEEAVMKVFASPNEGEDVEVDDSASFENCSVSFPQIYFSVNNFDSCFKDIRLQPSNVLIVELMTFTGESISLAKSMKGSRHLKFDSNDRQRVIFQGAIEYEAIRSAAYDKESSSLVMLNGPDGVGEAQIEVFLEEDSPRTKFKNILRSMLNRSEAKEKLQEKDFECRLRYIRMHWVDILSKWINK